MANQLTGDFEIVAQFAMPAVNRILAAMHRVERFPHSLAMRVEDVAPRGPRFDTPTVSTVSDGFGDPEVNHQRIGQPVLDAAASLNLGGTSRVIDPIVNIDLEDLQIEPVVPSQLQGHAQAQLFPPTVEIADAAAGSLTVRLGMMCRYLPDRGTPRVAEFVRGEVKITAPVSQIASQVANVVNIDVRASTASIGFTPQWSSTPITPEDRAGIDQLMRNALRTSFLPSNVVLPANIGHMQFKAMSGPLPAIAALIDSTGPAGNRASATNVFMSASDDFAFAAAEEYVKAAFQPAIDEILNTPVPPFSFSINVLLHTFNVTYEVTLNSAGIELRQGSILLRINGRARTGSSVAPNFNFTVEQPFTLSVAGAAAELEVGELSLDTTSWIADRFKGGALSRIARVRDDALTRSGARSSVRKLLNADDRLGGFFRSLLAPAREHPTPPGQAYSLAYSSVEIKPAGIVLHGSIAVAPWPPPRVEFEQVPVYSSSPLAGTGSDIASGPDYSALKSWIPGGTIDRYDWAYIGQGGGTSEPNKFIYRREPVSEAAIARTVSIGGYSPLCLTVHGRRLTSAGPPAMETVSQQACAFSSFPILDLAAAGNGIRPAVALASRGPDGNVRVNGHTPAAVDVTGSAAPNLVVHFADAESAARPDALMDALLASGRADAATAIVVITAPGELERARFAPGIVYTDDLDGAWARRYGLETPRRPLTVVADPHGKILGRQEGPVATERLAELLKGSLTTRRRSEATFAAAGVKAGRTAPNFILGVGDGRDITLRKLSGRELSLVFFSASSPAGLAFARDAVEAARRSGTVAIGIADGARRDGKRESGKGHGMDAIVVDDRDRKIADAYGVSVWPAVVNIDAGGTIRSVQYGFTSADHSGVKATGST